MNLSRVIELLKTKAGQGTLISLFGLVANQVIRLGGNLVLTRLLTPEAFGIASLLNMFVVGLYLVSNVGTDLAVVQAEHGDNPSFLNTSWTLETFRGALLTAIGIGFAYPFAVFYEEPRLVQMAPVAALVLVIQGLVSTKLYAAQRNLRLGRVVVLDVVSQVVGLIVTLALAVSLRSVWALVIGPLFYRISRTLLSHIWLPGENNRFQWDKSALGSIYRLGTWILISTTITFLASRIDVALIGKLLPLERVGVYAIAGQLAALPVLVSDQLCNQVLFPILADAYRKNREELADRFGRALKMVIPILFVSVAGTALVAPLFFHLLYDGRYADAGWMTQLMMVGVWFSILSEAMGRALQATGDTRTIAVANAVKLVVSTAGAVLGYRLFGTPGFILGCGSGAFAAKTVIGLAVMRKGLRPAPRWTARVLQYGLF